MIDGSTCRVLAQRMMHSSLCMHEQHLLDLHSKLVIVCMLRQTDLPCTTDVFEVALECVVDLFDRAQEVRIPLILQKIWTMVTVSTAAHQVNKLLMLQMARNLAPKSAQLYCHG